MTHGGVRTQSASDARRSGSSGRMGCHRGPKGPEPEPDVAAPPHEGPFGPGHGPARPSPSLPPSGIVGVAAVHRPNVGICCCRCKHGWLIVEVPVPAAKSGTWTIPCGSAERDPRRSPRTAFRSAGLGAGRAEGRSPLGGTPGRAGEETPAQGRFRSGCAASYHRGRGSTDADSAAGRRTKELLPHLWPRPPALAVQAPLRGWSRIADNTAPATVLPACPVTPAPRRRGGRNDARS
ncbi:hypothetical protein SAMN05421806_105212 [Streptomyces indicus]|uniref:Uncharacterized protein n=1 Tax=Streptomyces indicus TaxID=417292 RepID=A0A1G8ZV43_9ACTN|nr:hypothetical protein SAMN05421806_105212 [Streptomyces indicus]